MAPDIEKLIERHRPLIRRLCRAHAYDIEAAHDLEAESLFSIWRKRETFDPAKGSFGAWIGAIICHEAADVKRKARRTIQSVANTHESTEMLEGVEDGSLCSSPEQSLLDSFAVEILKQSGVREKLIDVLVLVKFEEMGYAEISARLGVTESTVRTYVWVARNKLKARLKANGHDSEVINRVLSSRPRLRYISPQMLSRHRRAPERLYKLLDEICPVKPENL